MGFLDGVCKHGWPRDFAKSWGGGMMAFYSRRAWAEESYQTGAKGQSGHAKPDQRQDCKTTENQTTA